MDWIETVLLFFRFSAAVAFAMLYSIGGREGVSLALRRYVGGALLVSSVIVIAVLSKTFNWWMIPIAFVLIGALTMGYGADDEDFFEKVLRRSIFGIVIGSYGLLMGITTGHYSMGAAQMLCAITASVFFGVLNPVTAVREEALIAFFSVILVLFMV